MRYLTPAEVAERLGITEQAVTRLCREGKVPGAIPPSDHWRIPASSVKKIPRRGKGRPRKEK